MSLNLFRKEQDARDEGQRADAEREAVNQRKAQQDARDEAEEEMDDLVNEIHRHTRRADKAKGMRDETIDRLQHATRANSTLDTGDPLQLVSQLMVVLLGIVGAYCFDYILFSSFVNYLLTLIGVTKGFLFWARVVVPAVVIGLELVLSALLYSAKQKAGTWRSPAVIGWTILAVATLVALSIMTAATILAGEQVESLWDMTLGQIMLMFPVTVFSAVPHAILLFSGRMGHEGKAMIFIIWRRFRARWLDSRYKRRADRGVAVYRRFARHLSRNPWFGPVFFTESARDIINERMGQDVILPPTSAFRGDGASPPSFSPAPDDVRSDTDAPNS